MGTETYHRLKKVLHDRGLGTGLGDEGGFAPNLATNADCARPARRGHRGRGLHPGDDIAIALDPATSELYRDGAYHLEGEGRVLSSAEMVDLWADLVATATRSSPSRTAWTRATGTAGKLTERLGDRVQIVGDDLLVTNPAFVRAVSTSARPTASS
jgi:enolase